MKKKNNKPTKDTVEVTIKDIAVVTTACPLKVSILWHKWYETTEEKTAEDFAKYIRLELGEMAMSKNEYLTKDMI